MIRGGWVNSKQDDWSRMGMLLLEDTREELQTILKLLMLCQKWPRKNLLASNGCLLLLVVFLRLLGWSVLFYLCESDLSSLASKNLMGAAVGVTFLMALTVYMLSIKEKLEIGFSDFYEMYCGNVSHL
jgi:hypothetical protein